MFLFILESEERERPYEKNQQLDLFFLSRLAKQKNKIKLF